MKTPLKAPVALRAIERRLATINVTNSRGMPCRRDAKAPRCASFAAAMANTAPHKMLDPIRKAPSGRPPSMASMVAMTATRRTSSSLS